MQRTLLVTLTAGLVLQHDLGGGGTLGIFLASFLVVLLSVAGLAASLLLRGRPLRAGCRGGPGTAAARPECPSCPADCPVHPRADTPARGQLPADPLIEA